MTRPSARRGFILTFLALTLGAMLLAALVPLAVVGWGWWRYKTHERSIVEKMDQYWLTVSRPGREEYLLGADEMFEVPYMASTLSAEAVPTRILDRRGEVVGEFSSERGVYVSDPDDLPAFLKKALVATEDGTFYAHHGINWKAVARAMLVNLRTLSAKQGGSTLTQQLAKLMFTTRKKTYGRKVYEAFCARKLEGKFTKDQILLMYFNFAYFGHGTFGVESASRFYFGKPAKELQLEEAAMLVGIIASPNKYSPIEHQDLARARHRTVLSRMAKLGFVPETAVERYHESFWRDWEARLRRPEVSFWRMRVNLAPYPVEHIRRRLERDFEKERILKGGLVVRTTLDLGLQRAAQDSLQRALREENKRSSVTAEGKPRPPVEGALAAVDPADGGVLAMVGGSGFDFKNQLIRAVDSSRPMGSSVKPFVFAAAFESGRFSPDDEMEDAPVSYKTGRKVWKPANYGNKYFGKVTLRVALWKSLNSVAIKLLEAADIDRVIGLLAAATGRERRHFARNLSLALGTSDLSALDMARAYAVFANGGRPVAPFFIRSIEDRDGQVVWSSTPTAAAEAILSPVVVSTMIEVMRGVLGPEGTAHGAAARTGFTLPAAGKTGTTNDYRDAWFAGVTPDLAAAVWVGHDDMRYTLGAKGTGGGLAAPVWMETVKSYYRDRPAREFDLAVSSAAAGAAAEPAAPSGETVPPPPEGEVPVEGAGTPADRTSPEG